MEIQAVIFDLDGVIVTTDHCHYAAWKRMADEENIPFDETINERLRGVSRMESLDVVLEKSARRYTLEQKTELAERKNSYYVEQIKRLTAAAILPGVMDSILALRKNSIKVAIGSSSKNAHTILEQIGIINYFDAVVDGNQIQKSKPDPEAFLRAAEQMQIDPDKCLVVEDADAGVIAAKKAGMVSLAVRHAKGGDFHCRTLAEVNILDFL